MNTSGVQTVLRYSLGAMKNGQTFPLVFFGDVHWGTRLMSRQAWDAFCDWGRAHPEARYIGMGDYVDMGSASERIALARAGSEVHEQTVDHLERAGLGLNQEFAKEIAFMKGRTIALLDGNHFLVDRQGVSMTQRLCDVLGCAWGGVSSFIRIVAGRSGSNSKACADIWAHHGRGAARMPGGSVNNVEHMRAIASCDVYAMAHDHRKWATGHSQLVVSEGGGGLTIQHRKQLLIRTGSFLRGYVKDQPSYVTDALYPPLELGAMIVWVTMVRNEHLDKETLSLQFKAEV